MRKSRRWLLLSSLVVILAMVMVSVGTTASKVQIRVSSWDGYLADTWKQVIAEFEKENPNIDVEIGFAEFTTYWQRLMTESLTGTAADVTQNMVGNIIDYAKMKAVKNLAPYVKRDLNMKDYFPVMFDPYYYPLGKTTSPLYAVPFISFDMVMFYNKTIFDKYGVSYPDSATWSWDAFLDAAKKTTKDTNGDGVNEIWGFDANPTHDQIYPWISTAGGRWWDASYKKCMISSPESVNGSQFFFDLISKYKVAPSPANRMQGIVPFMSGQIAMAIDGTWNMEMFRQIKDFGWDIADIPYGKVRGGYSMPGTMAIPATCKHTAEAWKFIKFLIGEKAQVILAQGGYGIPINRAAAATFFDPQKHPAGLKAILNRLGAKNYFWIMNAKASEYRKAYEDEMMLVGLGKKDLKQALDDATVKINKIEAAK